VFANEKESVTIHAMNDQSPQLAIVMPVYNEEANIRNVLEEWFPVLDEQGISYCFVPLNDGSKDGTLDVLKEMAAQHPEKIAWIDKPNSGHGRTCRVGYERALEMGALWILQIDSDGQCDPAYFSEFWRQREEADCVFGFGSVRDDGLARKVISRICTLLTTLVAGVAVRDGNVPYRLMCREALEKGLSQVPADFDIQNVALTVALKRLPELRWKYVPIRFRDRQGGSNSINIPKIAKMGWNMLRELRRVR